MEWVTRIRDSTGHLNGGPYQGPRTITIRKGTSGANSGDIYVHPNGESIVGVVKKSHGKAIEHTHGQRIK